VKLKPLFATKPSDTRAALAALMMPVVVAAVMTGLLVASHHTHLPSLGPSASPLGSRAAADAARCRRGITRRPFIGIAINPRITAHVRSFQHVTGAHIQMVEFYNPFTKPFQRWEVQQATALGVLPLIQLNPRHVSLARIAAGRYDGMVRQYADSVRDFRCRVVISFGHEMNGWWYTWGEPRTSPATFIAAWRHIHNIFVAEGATNVVWSWDPSHQYRYQATMASRWYPGSAYVDWVGIDGYLGRGQTVAQVFGTQLRDIRRVTSKPVYFAETGVAGGPDQSWQIAALFAALKTYNLTGLVWFDLNRKQPWRLEGRPAGLAAYRKAVATLMRPPSRTTARGPSTPASGQAWCLFRPATPSPVSCGALDLVGRTSRQANPPRPDGR
jgi:mannan endo-1,4-beta-mannosidase